MKAIWWIIPSCCLCLTALSILVLKSVAPHLSSLQFVFALIGAALFLTASQLHFSVWKRAATPLYIGLCILLLTPLMLGRTTRGIAGWIEIGGFFSVQPSQLAVPIVGLAAATFLQRHSLKQWSTFLHYAALVGVPLGLILLEPDLGTAVIYAGALGAPLLFQPTPRWFWPTLVAGVAMASAISWLFLLKPYQKDRLISFFTPNQATELSPAAYNAQQSMVAVGSGEFIGRGLGQGVQSHLRFLPERQTDFIFASLSEELGFVGSSLVLGVYSVLLALFVWLWLHLPERAERSYVLIALTMTVLQAGINMGMNMGLLPITGITLPLLSYGGSSLLSVALLYGIVWSIQRRQVEPAPLHIE